VGDVQGDRSHAVRRAPLAPATRRAFRQFVDAVLALSDDPEPANVERYLEASRTLDESRGPRQTMRRSRPTAKTGDLR
jgi:hypothetical protein